MTHICISKGCVIGLDNGLLPRWCQAIIWTKAGILLTGPLWINFSEILIDINTFSFKKMHLKMTYAKKNYVYFVSAQCFNYLCLLHVKKSYNKQINILCFSQTIHQTPKWVTFLFLSLATQFQQLPVQPMMKISSKWWLSDLTHWGQVTHICVSKVTIIGPDNGLPPGWCRAIIWTNAGLLLIQTMGTNFSETLSEIHTFLLKKMHLKMSAGWRQFCLGLNVLKGQSALQREIQC